MTHSNIFPQHSGGLHNFRPVVPSTAGILDEQRVHELLSLNSEDEPNVFDELLDLFISETTSQMNVLRQAASAGDTTIVRRIAHRLKGGSRSFAIPLLGDQCEALEQMPDSADAAWLGSSIDRMEETFALAVRALQRFTSRGS